jgi:hypothetical protein
MDQSLMLIPNIIQVLYSEGGTKLKDLVKPQKNGEAPVDFSTLVYQEDELSFPSDKDPDTIGSTADKVEELDPTLEIVKAETSEQQPISKYELQSSKPIIEGEIEHAEQASIFPKILDKAKLKDWNSSSSDFANGESRGFDKTSHAELKIDETASIEFVSMPVAISEIPHRSVVSAKDDLPAYAMSEKHAQTPPVPSIKGIAEPRHQGEDDDRSRQTRPLENAKNEVHKAKTHLVASEANTSGIERAITEPVPVLRTPLEVPDDEDQSLIEVGPGWRTDFAYSNDLSDNTATLPTQMKVAAINQWPASIPNKIFKVAEIEPVESKAMLEIRIPARPANSTPQPIAIPDDVLPIGQITADSREFTDPVRKTDSEGRPQVELYSGDATNQWIVTRESESSGDDLVTADTPEKPKFSRQETVSPGLPLYTRESDTAAIAVTSRSFSTEPDVDPAIPELIEVSDPKSDLFVPHEGKVIPQLSHHSFRIGVPIPVQQQLAEIIHTHGAGKTDVTLSPEELGRVTLSISPLDREITVNIVAERPETLDLIKRNIDQLSAELKQLGYSSAQFSFGTNGAPPKGSQTGAGNSHPAPDDQRLSDGQDVVAESAISMTTTGIDLRL